MIRAMQGWMAFPFRLAIAIAVAWMLSYSFNAPTSKLDLAFLAQPEVQAPAEQQPVVEKPLPPAQPATWASGIGISATVALVLYVWIAYEWVGFSRFNRACVRLKRLGAVLRFEFDLDQPFWRYYFRAETSVDLSKKRLNAEHFQLLKQLPNVTALRLAHAKVPDDLVKRLRRLKKLRKVDVLGVSLTDAERRSIAQLTVR